MRIISFNVNGIRATVKKGLMDSINKMQPDIIGFQETKANDAQTAEALADIKGYHLYTNSAERPGYSGTAVLTKVKPLNVTKDFGVAEHANEGRTLTLEFDEFYFVNCYVPNSGQELIRLDYRQKWDNDLFNYLTTLDAKKPVIFCGDLNVAHKPIDLANPKSNYNKTAGYTQKEIDGLDNLMTRFVDSYRQLYPDTIKYSWWSARFNSRAKNVGWRIDYVLVSPLLVPKIKDAFILNEIEGSDHCPVGIDIV
jgi:exodeoxyribonuclease III